MRKQINIRLPDEIRRQLEALIALTGMTTTQLIITAINEYYTRRIASQERHNV